MSICWNLVLHTTMLRAAAISISLIALFEWRLNCPTVGLKIPSRPTFTLKSHDDFCVMDRALIINVLEFNVEGIFNHIVLFFRRGVSTNKADVIKFWSDADCGYSLV